MEEKLVGGGHGSAVHIHLWHMVLVLQLVCESAVSSCDNHREMKAVKEQNDSGFT